MQGKEYAGWLADKICGGGDYSKESALVLVRQADEIERLRDCAGKVIAAFETLGRTSGMAELLSARARCESVMIEMKSVLTPNTAFNERVRVYPGFIFRGRDEKR